MRRTGVIAIVDNAASYRIQKIGGPGKEFWVDGINYDNNGNVAALLQKKDQIEPGHWRVAVSPRVASETVEFNIELSVNPAQ